jgi:hypothetical protein
MVKFKRDEFKYILISQVSKILTMGGLCSGRQFQSPQNQIFNNFQEANDQPEAKKLISEHYISKDKVL